LTFVAFIDVIVVVLKFLGDAFAQICRALSWGLSAFRLSILPGSKESFHFRHCSPPQVQFLMGFRGITGCFLLLPKILLLQLYFVLIKLVNIPLTTKDVSHGLWMLFLVVGIERFVAVWLI
jgi:hypothetical protein